jgi:hypothetical protein
MSMWQLLSQSLEVSWCLCDNCCLSHSKWADACVTIAVSVTRSELMSVWQLLSQSIEVSSYLWQLLTQSLEVNCLCDNCSLNHSKWAHIYVTIAVSVTRSELISVWQFLSQSLEVSSYLCDNCCLIVSCTKNCRTSWWIIFKLPLAWRTHRFQSWLLSHCLHSGSWSLLLQQRRTSKITYSLTHLWAYLQEKGTTPSWTTMS